MKSHDYARKLHELADYLLARPEFETPYEKEFVYLGHYWNKKHAFLSAAKALAPVTKEYKDGDLRISTTNAPLEISMNINRSSVCVKVQDERWECEPLLRPEEEAAIDAEVQL